jgi:DeoR/GlpR family transcriptional regulator of sugar metabolism
MFAAQRRREIMQILRENGSVPVAELSRRFGVSEVTIRLDLRKLNNEGRIERNYGGASLPEEDALPFSAAVKLLKEAKATIAGEAFKLVGQGDTLFLDASSTTLELAKLLASVENITIISNSIQVYEQFKEYRKGTLVGVAGVLNPLSQSFVGSFAENMVGGLKANKAFISPKGILLEGLRDNNMAEAAIRRKMIEAADEVVVLADSSKFNNRRVLFGIQDFGTVRTVVTDRLPEEAFVRFFEEKKIRLIVAGGTAD